MPEARALVTDGLYGFIRHPLYMAELIALAGFFLQYRSWEAAIILAVMLFFQLKRMDWEEQILAEAFPEYESYRQQSWRLLPGVY
jgi:protein-S-isoprenylcysteine O-methyltransferase Ste14